jgi:hypothetical protein
VPVHPWDEPKGNWDRINIDHAGPFQDHFLLIVVDAKSGWAEIKTCHNPPTSTTTIEMLPDIFAIHGYPHVMVSDNATIFAVTSSNRTVDKTEFSKSLSHQGTQLQMDSLSTMYTLKTRLKAMGNEPFSMHAKVREIMFRY